MKGKGKPPPASAELIFSPRLFRTGPATLINVAVETSYSPRVQFFNLYSFDSENGQASVPEASLLPSGVMADLFQGTIVVQSRVPSETLGFRAIPVIGGTEDPSSPLVVTDTSALRSIPGGIVPPPTLPPNEEDSPTTAPNTAAPTPTPAPNTEVPTIAPITLVPTTTATTMPTSAPVADQPSAAPISVSPTEPAVETPTSMPVTAVPSVATTSSPSREGTPTSPPDTAMPTEMAAIANPTVSPSTAVPTPGTSAEPTPSGGFEEIITLQGEVGGEFGRSVALSSDASFLAVGAPENDDAGLGAGRVALYRLGDDTAELLYDFFGADELIAVGLDVKISSMSGSGGGPRLAIGGLDFVDVYPLDQFLDDPDPDDLIFDRFESIFADEGFGESIGISGNGEFIAVSSPIADILGGEEVGLVQVIRLGSGGELIGNDIDGEGTDDRLGTAVALSGDGTIIVVGAPGVEGAGYVRVHELSEGGTSWDLVGQRLEGAVGGDRFGRSVDISEDGQTVAVGATQFESGSGYVVVYQFDGSAWGQIGQTLIGDEADDQFGMSVVLTPDAKYLSVGANTYDIGFVNNGLVRVYENVDDEWIQVGPDVVGSSDSRNLGVGLAMSADGRTVAAGGPFSTSEEDRDIGETVVFNIR